jgi:hypothetical protein
MVGVGPRTSGCCVKAFKVARTFAMQGKMLIAKDVSRLMAWRP